MLAQRMRGLRMVRIKAVLLTAALLLLTGNVFAGDKIGFRLQGGWTYVAGGDVNSGTRALFDYRASRWPSSTGEYGPVHSGYEFAGDVIFEITPRLGIGIGGGYLRLTRRSSFYLSDPEIINSSATLAVAPTINALSIRASIHLTVPVMQKFVFRARVGPLCYISTRYSDEWLYDVFGFDLVGYVHITTHADRPKSPIGFDGSIGLEYELRHNLFVYFDAQGRYARFQGWRGSSVIERSNELPSTEEGLLYYESAPMLNGAPRLIMVQSSPPAGPGGEPRQAAIDLSGVSLQIGIRIRL